MTKKNIIIAAIVVAVLYFGLDKMGYLPGTIKHASAVPVAVDLSTTAESTSPSGAVAAIPLPSSKLASVSSPPICVQTIPWNGTMGFQFAVGGAQTTEGSLMAKYGIKVRTARQDDVEKMKADQVLFANALAEGQPHPSVGCHFVIIMGDGAAQYVTAMNGLLKNLGDEYRVEEVGSVGYSRGEDGCYGPQEWKDNPQAAAGKMIAGYLRDGDWNLCLFWMTQNGLKNNPDETTYDPEAVNWSATSDFLVAVQQYVSGYCEDRKVVIKGKLTGEKKNICVEGTATWTPGDVTQAKQKGGLVRLISTKENSYQMNAAIIGVRAWNIRNAKLVEGMLQAALEGGEQVKRYDTALSRAGTISANVYGDQTAAYWVKYFRGTREKDKTGAMVDLGGSTTMNLADNLVLYGLADGSGGLKASARNASYTGFGNVVKQQYPKLFPSFVPIEQAVNTQFITALANRLQPKDSEADVAVFENTGVITAESTVAKRNWQITFATGSAQFTPAATVVLTDLYNQMLNGGALAIQVEGHTDNVGDVNSNQALSEARAFAVKNWMEQKNPRLFPEGRINVRGFGQTAPIAPNGTDAGRAQNRRVTIVLGTNQ